MKKIVSALLALCLLMGFCAFAVSANDGEGIIEPLELEASAPDPALWFATSAEGTNSYYRKLLRFSKAEFPLTRNSPAICSPFYIPRDHILFDEAFTTYYPAVEDGKIKLLYYIVTSTSPRYPGTAGKSGNSDLVEALNGFIGDTSADKPLYAYRDANQDLVLQSENLCQTLLNPNMRDERVEIVPRAYEDTQLAFANTPAVNLLKQTGYQLGIFTLGIRPIMLRIKFKHYPFDLFGLFHAPANAPGTETETEIVLFTQK